MSDIVDLTHDTPPEPAVGSKRPRCSSGPQEEEESRQRIMSYCRRVQRSTGCATDVVESAVVQSAVVPAAAAPAPAGGTGDDEEAAARLRIMSFAARQVVAGATVPPPPAANSLLAQLHAERMARRKPAAPAADVAVPLSSGGVPAQQQEGAQPRLSLLTWNVWFREDIHIGARMEAVGKIITEKAPDFVCLQEVTPLIYALLSAQAWWPRYGVSARPQGAPYFTVLLWRRATVQQTGGSIKTADYPNSIMGRDLKSFRGTVCGIPVMVATTHLESPTGWQQLFSEQRVSQCKQALAALDRADGHGISDFFLEGDMNWDVKDGQPPLPGGWSDAWVHLHPGDPGLTYDPRQNPMLKPGNRIRRRLDRVFVRIRRWRLEKMELVGRERLPHLEFEGRPVLASDHFGLLLELHG